MKRIVFANAGQSVFAESGLVSFDDFLDYYTGKRTNRNDKRHAIKFALGNGSKRKQVFMKCFFGPHFKDMLFAWRSTGRPCSQARYEWENTKLLSSNGIASYKPVCYAEQLKWGMERKSLIVTEELQAQPLTEFVSRKWHHLKTGQKEKIIVDLAVFVRTIHNARISLPDLYLWHIFIRQGEEPNEWDFAVIDLRRMARDVRSRSRQIENLGRLDHSMLGKYFDQPMRRLFIESYAGENWPGGIEKLAAKVKKYSDTLSSKRNQKPY